MNENGTHRSMSADPDPGGGGGGGGPIPSQGSSMSQTQPMSPPTRDYGATSGTGNPARYDLGGSGVGGDLNAAAVSVSSSAFAYAMRPSVTSAASELFVQTTSASASLRPRPPTAGGNAAAANSGPNMFVGSPPPPPVRNDASDVELDYGQNNVPLLKAQLKLVTHERDMLTRDVKRFEMEKDVASAAAAAAAAAASSKYGRHGAGAVGQPFGAGSTALDHHHSRTASDSAQTPSKHGTASNPGLSRSHSIAASSGNTLLLSPVRDIAIGSMVGGDMEDGAGGGMVGSPPPPGGPLGSSATAKASYSLLHGMQVMRKQNSDAEKKLDQAVKDMEYYHREAETMRARYNDVFLEKERLEQEVNSVRCCLEDERKEMAELRRQQQDLLSAEGGAGGGGGPGESLSIMYSTLLRNYEAAKEDNSHLRRNCDELVASHAASIAKMEHMQDEISRYKKLYQDMLTERNQFNQQCTQAIRQWDQALRERNDYKDALVKTQRQHDEAVKEVNQAMTVRIKASKDMKRLTEERNAAMQEYSLIMSERDAVHKEIEKLQEEVKNTKMRMTGAEHKNREWEEERRKMLLQVETLKREIEQALYDRDQAIREAQELRDKLGCGKTLRDHSRSSPGIGVASARVDAAFRKNRYSAASYSSETLESALAAVADRRTKGKISAGGFGPGERLENVDVANVEIDRLRKVTEELGGELHEAGLEADVAKCRRDLAFSERDKAVLERESIRTLCDKLRRERDRAVSDLAEALRDCDDCKKQMNGALKENKEIRERLETLEKEIRVNSLQRASNSHSHSHDSAIDSDLHEWETEDVDIDLADLGPTEELGLDLGGGRDDAGALGLAGHERPVYVASLTKGGFMEACRRLKVNDCILRVNNLDCRDVERGFVVDAIRNSRESVVNVTVKRRKIFRRHVASLHLNGAPHGITLDLGVYISRIAPGSAAAKEGSVAVGDRILSINDRPVDHVDHIGEAVELLNANASNSSHNLALTVAKSSSALFPPHLALSSSSSGHNLTTTASASSAAAAVSSAAAAPSSGIAAKSATSIATSPIKDTMIRGSQEFVRRLIASHHSGIASSSSSEKIGGNNANAIAGASKSSMGLVESVMDKVKKSRGRRSSKEPQAHHDFRMAAGTVALPPDDKASRSEEVVLAELDSVLDSFHHNQSEAAAPSNQSSKQQLTMNSSGGSSSGGSKSSKKKQRSSKSSASDKQGHHNHTEPLQHPVKAGISAMGGGGTWPRTRGGPIIDQGTGTILHPQKMKKERLPLSELLNNLPKYPPDKKQGKMVEGIHRTAEVIGRSSTRRIAQRPLTTYGVIDITETPSAYRPLDPLTSLPPAPSLALAAPYNAEQQQRATIDDSVKSAHPGKDELARYLRKSSSSSIKSSSPSNAPSSLTLPQQLVMPPPPSTSSSSSARASATLKAAQDLAAARGDQQPFRTSASGFSPYFAPQPSHGVAASSPRYSSPPPLVSAAAVAAGGEPLLGSPIATPDYRAPQTSSAYGLPIDHHHHHSQYGGGGTYGTANAAIDLLSMGSSRYHGSSGSRASSVIPSAYTTPHSQSPGIYGHHQLQPQQPSYYAHHHHNHHHHQQQHQHYGLPPPPLPPPPPPPQLQPSSLSYRAQPDPLEAMSPPPLYPDSQYGIGRHLGMQPRRTTRDGSEPSYPTRVRIPSNQSIGSSSLGSSVTKMSSSSSIDHHYQQPGGGQYYQQQVAQPQHQHGRPTPPHVYYQHHHHQQQHHQHHQNNPPPLQPPASVGLGSNNSVGSKCASPLPVVSVHYIVADGNTTRMVAAERMEDRKPRSGDIREINIEKTSEQLGITIEDGSNKGVFVSSVSEHSLAAQVGLQVGDQLLDVAGINLRGVNKEQAARVLNILGKSTSIKIRVQFNPEEFHGSLEGVAASPSEEEGDDEEEELSDDDDDPSSSSRLPSIRRAPAHLSPGTAAGSTAAGAASPQRSGSPTPRNSPKLGDRGGGKRGSGFETSAASTLRGLPPSAQSTLTRPHINQILPALRASTAAEPPRAPASPPYEPRLVYPTMKKSGDLGVRLVGGNAVGIFIHSVEIDSAAFAVSLRCADQILEYNNVDLRRATAEQAAYELAKPAENVAILIQYNPDKYNMIKDQPGDAYFVRSMFDRNPVDDYGDPPHLSFAKDDILYIDNTMYNGVPGNWSAWFVNQEGKTTQWGIIPSKYKVEEELLMKRSLGGGAPDPGESDGGGGSTRSSRGSHWTKTARRSFLKRRKGGSSLARSSSRDSKELATFSDMGSLSSFAADSSGALHEDPHINSYVRVERLDYLVTRPVLIIGPLAEAVVDKLLSDYPHKFSRCKPKFTQVGHEDLERGVLENSLIEFKRRGSNYECTTVESVRDICDRNQHCILSIHLENLERLHQNQIYPIVLLIKFKTFKQLKEVKVNHMDSRVWQKDAKNIFEHTQKIEAEYKHLISDTIHAGANLMLMCAQIATSIDQEQNKTLWVPSGTIW